MADAELKATKDRHPELSSPIVDLSLEARIARAEQAVIDRDARVRADARHIVDTLRSKRGAAVRWASIAGAAAAAGAIGYAGYKAWHGRKSPPWDEKRTAEPSKAMSFASEIAALVGVAMRWASKLHREQGVSGSLFGMMRSALWPVATTAPPTAAGAAGPSDNTRGYGIES